MITPGREGAAVAIAAVVLAVALVFVPAGTVGGGDVQFSLNGLGRAAAWAVAWSLGAVLLAGRGQRRSAGAAAAVAALAVGLAAVRFPVGLLGLLLLTAIVVPRLAGSAPAGWSRVLVFGCLGPIAATVSGFSGRQQGNEAVVIGLVFGFLAAAGALPFGLHAVRWMQRAIPEVGALVGSAFLPCVLAALVAAEPSLAASHAGSRIGLVLGVFGAATAIAGAVYAMGADDWRGLALRTVPCEVGLALVGIAAFDIHGLQGAALSLALLAVTRPVLVYVDLLGPRRGAGLVLTALVLASAAGLPPTLGFPARLLVISAAIRVGPVVAVLTVAGVILELAAIAVVLRRRLAHPPREALPASPRSVVALAAATAGATLAGGVFPAFLLGSVFQLGG